jgi:hypothetical protein
MVGFIKELVDEQGAKDLTRARVTGTATRGSKFENLTVTPLDRCLSKSDSSERIRHGSGLNLYGIGP